MRISEVKIGMMVKIKLRRKYTKDEIEDWADPRINGRVGTITNDWGGGWYEIQLRRPLKRTKRFVRYNSTEENYKNLIPYKGR